MADRYLSLVNSGPGAAVAGRLGLPRPAVLRRYRPGEPALPGPVLLGGANAGLSELLVGAGYEVRGADADDARWGALVFDATGLSAPEQLAELRAFLAGPVRRLAPSGRVLLISRLPDGEDPVVDATRQAVTGIVRSLAKELRAGATANLVQLTADAGVADAEGPVRFFLSGRSAYVDGQLVEVGPGAGRPDDWDQPLAGKVALVTGAARGIGAAIAEVLARDGAIVVAADLPAAGDALAKVANRVGGTALQLDIAAPDAAGTVTGYFEQRYGHLNGGGVDIVVHNAGITRDKLLANMKPEQWDSVIAVNLAAQLRINAALLDTGCLRTGGRVVGLASTSGIAGNRGQTNYAASKAGVIGMVRSYAPRFAERQAAINAVAPGFIDTDMTRAMPALTREVARRLASLQQAGQPVDVAEAVAFLSQPGGVTGQVLRVCGQNMIGA